MCRKSENNSNGKTFNYNQIVMNVKKYIVISLLNRRVYVFSPKLREKLSNFIDLKTAYTLYQYSVYVRVVFSPIHSQQAVSQVQYVHVNNVHSNEKRLSNLPCLLTVKNHQIFYEN